MKAGTRVTQLPSGPSGSASASLGGMPCLWAATEWRLMVPDDCWLPADC